VIFTGLRVRLVARLECLKLRYFSIGKRALDYLEEAEFAQRNILITSGETIAVLEEIIGKTSEQRQLCDDAIEHLAIKRSNPLVFRGAVKKAEKFADQCEAVLDQIDAAKQWGREAFRKRFEGLK